MTDQRTDPSSGDPDGPDDTTGRPDAAPTDAAPTDDHVDPGGQADAAAPSADAGTGDGTGGDDAGGDVAGGDAPTPPSGTALTPAGTSAPDPAGAPAEPSAGVDPAAAGIDPEQLRQFQQFQQFQEFLKFQQAQQEQGGAVVPTPQYAPTQYSPVQPPAGPHAAAPGAVTTTDPRELAPQPAERPKRRVPRWLTWLGKKVLAWLIAVLLLGIAATWAYNHFFGSGGEGKSTEEYAREGGGTYHTNQLFSTDPYAAVKTLYQLVGENNAEACQLFDFEKGADQQFARNVGYGSCKAAVSALATQVSDVTEYSRSIYPQRYDYTTDTLQIDSCDSQISGGPALGTVTVSKVEEGQWLITGHERGPETCPGQGGNSGSATPTN